MKSLQKNTLEFSTQQSLQISSIAERVDSALEVFSELLQASWCEALPQDEGCTQRGAGTAMKEIGLADP